jgi:hypothetical protein
VADRLPRAPPAAERDRRPDLSQINAAGGGSSGLERLWTLISAASGWDRAMQDLKGKRIALLATDGFKEIEFLET